MALPDSLTNPEFISLVVNNILAVSKPCLILAFVYVLFNLINRLLNLKRRDGWKCRSRKNVNVQCWFCQAETTVPAGNQNCFDCPECEQYNGFTQNGDYNKPIPSQYSEELNHVYSRPAAEWSVARPSAMCSVCQSNQQLRVQQLAAFVPSNEDNFDAEVDEYSLYLDEAYRLCPACDDIIYNELNQQDKEIKSKLLGHRLKQSVLGSTQNKTAHSRYSQPWNVTFVSALCVASSLAAFLVMLTEINTLIDLSYQENDHSLVLQGVSFLHITLSNKVMSVSLLGLASGVLASLIAGKHRLRYLDGVCPFLWVLSMWARTSLLSWTTTQSVVLQDSPMTSAIISIVPSVLSALLWLTCTRQAFGRGARKNTTFINRRLDTESSTLSPLSNNSSCSEPSPPSSQSDSEQMIDNSRGQGSEVKQRLLDQVDLDALTLGPPGTARRRNKDMWTAHTPPTSRPTTPLLDDRPSSSREYRPIISPATFNLLGMKRSPSQSSFASSFSTALSSGQDHQVTSSKELFPDIGRGNSFQVYSDDSSHGSLSLGMSAKEPEIRDCNTASQKSTTSGLTMAFLLPCMFGFSLGINAAVAVYFLYGR